MLKFVLWFSVKSLSDINTVKELCRGCDIHLEMPELKAIVIEAPRHIASYLSRLLFVQILGVQWNIEMINAIDV
uniref:Uncharacterized protein n=1 Tax=Ignisphaera aggregans TaxID=334771 RepID=A0A7C4BD30_9CREN